MICRPVFVRIGATLLFAAMMAASSAPGFAAPQKEECKLVSLLQVVADDVYCHIL